MSQQIVQRQLLIMMNLQNELNSQIDADWRSAGNEWYRAIWIECAELATEYGYKWWKKQVCNIDQVKLEVVDIWHFGLSMLIEKDTDFKQLSKAIDIYIDTPGVFTPLEKVEDLASKVLESTRYFPIYEFIALMSSLNMTFEELYVLYIGKNVLNKFRQDNGYKEGTYKKMWGDVTDNIQLVYLNEDLDINSEDYPESLYKALDMRYRSCL